MDKTLFNHLRLFCVLLVVLVFTGLSESQQDQCYPVYQREIQCLEQGTTVEIMCPEIGTAEHRINIGRAVVKKAESPTDCVQGPNDCINSAITFQLREACNGNMNCSYTLQPDDTSLTNCADFGPAYIDVEYNCLAMHNQNAQARAIALCSDAVWEVSNFHMDSVPLALVNFTLRESNCACSVTVPAGVELRMEPFWFVKIPTQPRGSCDQKVEIWTQYGKVQEICDIMPNDETVFPCVDYETTYYARYVTSDTSVEVAFIVNFNVNSERMVRATCNSDFDFIAQPSPTTPTTTTTTTTTTTPTTTPTTTTTTPTTTSTTPTTTTTTATSPTTPTTTTSTTTTTTTSTTTPTTTATTPTTTTTTTEPTTTTATTTSTTTTTTTTQPTTAKLPTRKSDDEENKSTIWPIIVGVLAAGAVLLLICCLFIGLCFRGERREKEVFVEPAESERSSEFTYVTEVYVDGNQKKHLMVGRPATLLIGSNINRAFLN